MVEILGHGVYSFSDAARLTRLKTARVREWFLPKCHCPSPSVFESDYSKNSAENIVSFLDMVEVFVAGQLRERGISLQKIRKIHSALAEDFKTDHPFCHKEIRIKGKSVFTLGLDTAGREEIFDVLTKQKVFPKIIKPFLHSLDYNPTSRLAAKWNIWPGVVVDPQICFGQPIVSSVGIPTCILAKAFEANGRNAKAVASWYGITNEEVRAAVRFEHNLAA